MATIKYIPFSDKGPHYVESGARPETPAWKMFPDIIVQTRSGIRAAYFAPDPEDVGPKRVFLNHALNPINDVICWWHLPDPAPATEREWFKAQFKPESPDVFVEAISGKGYIVIFFPKDDISTKDLYIVGKDDYKAQFETQEAAIDAAYDHWVAAGRP